MDLNLFRLIISVFTIFIISNIDLLAQSVTVSPTISNPNPTVSVQISGNNVDFSQSSPTSCNSILNISTSNVLLKLNTEEHYATSLNVTGANFFGAEFNLTSATDGLYDVIVGSDQGCPVSCNACFKVCSGTILSTPSNIIGSNLVKRGDTLVAYSIPPLVGATSYLWSIPSGATIISGQGSTDIQVYFGFSSYSGNVRVQGVSDCGNGPQSSPLAVTVQYVYLSSTTSGSLGESNISVQIAGSGVNFTQSSPTSCSGMINVSPANVVLDNGTDLINASSLNQWVDGSNQFYGVFNIPGGVSTGSYDVVVDYGGSCVFSCDNCFNVNCLPFAAGNISGNSFVDAGDNNTVYTTSVINNATSYLWTFPSGITIVSGDGTNSVIVNYTNSAQSGSVYVRGVNACGNGPYSAPLAVTVRKLTSSPSAATQGDNITVSLAGSNVTFSQSSPTSCPGYLNLDISNVLISNGNENYNATAVNGLSAPNINCTANFDIPSNAIPGAYDVIIASGSSCPLTCHSCLQIDCASPSLTNNNQTICNGDSYLFNGNTYLTTNTYYDTLSNSLGCDSIIATNLTVTFSSLTGYVLLNSNGISAGVVELYSASTDSIANLSLSTTINGDGSYYFTNVLSGEYLIRAIADSGLYPNTIPTYADSTHRWDSAKVWITNCGADVQNVYIIELLPPTAMGADVSGYIMDDDTLATRKAGEPVRGAGVIIERKPNGSPSLRTTTNELGLYSFHGISLGDYDVYVEMPNATMLHTHSFSVTDTTLILENLNFYIDSVKGTIDTSNVNNPDSVFQTKVRITEPENIKNTIYPVPFNSTCKLNINSSNNEVAKIWIENSEGRVLSFIGNVSLKKGENNIQLNHFIDKPTGLYFVRIQSHTINECIRVVKE